VVEPVTTASLVTIARRQGTHAAVLAYKKAAPGWAVQLAKAGLDGLERPRPRLALMRALRKKDSNLLLLLTEAVVRDQIATPPPALVEVVDVELGHSRRWRRIDADVRGRRAASVAGKLTEGLVGSLEPAKAVSIADRANRNRTDRLERKLNELGAVQLGAMEELRADHAAEGAARLRERLAGLPVIARSALEAGFQEDPENVGEVLRAITAPGENPGQVAVEWVRRPPAFLGTLEQPRHPAAWRALACTAYAYTHLDTASVTFEMAAAAGGVPRDQLVASAAWSALSKGDRDRAESIMQATDVQDTTGPMFRAVSLLLEVVAIDPVPDSDRSELHRRARAEIASWSPHDPFGRDLRARLGAELEVHDLSQPPGARHNAALRILDETLAHGWIDETALATGNLLRMRAESGVSADRSADLDRAYALALKVREERKRTGGDTVKAVRDAAEAGGLARRWRNVIRVGSAEFGDATDEEARDPATVRYVATAAVLSDPHIAHVLEQRLDQMPESFIRAWLRAFLLGRPGRAPELTRQEKTELWRAALQAATSDGERQLAERGAAAEGTGTPPSEAGGSPQPWYTAELSAHAALSVGDALGAVTVLLPFRRESPMAAVLLAEAYAQLGETESAIDELTQAAQRFDYDDLIVQAALVAADADDRAHAEQLLEGVLRTASPAWAGRAKALLHLGEMQAARGAWAEAMTSWTTSLEQDPFGDAVRWYLAQCHGARSNFDQAWETLTADPATPGAHRDPPAPPSAHHARVLLVLTARNQPPHVVVARGLEQIDRFGDDVDFTAVALLIMLSATAADPDSAPEPGEEIDEQLAARLQAALGAFLMAHPDHPALRAVPIDPATSGEELVERLASGIDPVAPQRIYASKIALFAISRGTLPFGTLSSIAPRRYARLLAEQAIGVITARADEAEHQRSVGEAFAALGIDLGGGVSGAIRGDAAPTARGLIRAVTVPTASVVIDTTALYARSALASVDATLVADLREILLADAAYSDLMAAHDEIVREQGMHLFVDPEIGRPIITETPKQLRARHTAQIKAMLHLASSTRREPAPGTTRPELDALVPPAGAPWLESVRLAASRGAFLWADDAALRAVARRFGLPCFSTSALLEALEQLGKLTAEQHEQAVRALIRRQVGDFPLDPQRLRDLSRQDSEGRDAAISTLAKPSAWQRFEPAARTFANLLNDLRSLEPEAVPNLTAAAVLGIIRRDLPPQAAVEQAASILATAMDTVGPLGDVPAVLAGARAALRQAPMPLPDLLPNAAARILRAGTSLTDAQTAAALLTALTAQCEESDKQIARMAVLTA
jgi:tetratricopeptide (TPR) repeat protein